MCKRLKSCSSCRRAQEGLKMGLFGASCACDPSFVRYVVLLGRSQASWPKEGHECAKMASRWPPNGPKMSPQRGPKWVPKGPPALDRFRTPFCPPPGLPLGALSEPLWGPIGALLAARTQRNGSEMPFERVQMSTSKKTCDILH